MTTETWDVQFQDPEGYSNPPKYNVKGASRDEAIKNARDRLNREWATSGVLARRAKTFTLKHVRRSDSAEQLAALRARADGITDRVQDDMGATADAGYSKEELERFRINTGGRNPSSGAATFTRRSGSKEDPVDEAINAAYRGKKGPSAKQRGVTHALLKGR